ncbi:unnamed protein product, partial [marine sediment metagenome]
NYNNNDTAMSKTKHCKRCGRTLSIEQFHRDKKSKDGRAFYCKECVSIMGKKYRDTPSGIYSGMKSRSKYYKNNRPNNYKPLKITEKDFIAWYVAEPKICAYCDIPEILLHRVDDALNNKINRLSIDCKDNEVGYKIGNIVLACNRCNYMKSDVLSFEQMRYIGQTFLKPIWQSKLAEIQ